MKRTALLLHILLLALPVGAIEDKNSDGVVSLLVPIAFSSTRQTIPGAHGTLWTTELWYRNGSTRDIQSLQPTGICMPVCIVGFPSGGLGLLTGTHSNNGNGAMLHVPKEAAHGFVLTARLLELSRQSQPTGIEIPVIPEGQFFTGERWLLGVPSNSAVRSALRVYDPRALPGTELAVDFVATDGNVLASTVLRPGDDPRVLEPGPVHVPSVAASFDITADFPVLQQHETYHVRIRPNQEGREYWAMVSVTHNSTQHVLLITSQP